uniref:Uncharacterized protein n=1 Tax=Arundo donax TaxID=35708 RepID=A0A0A9B1J7_ARUDO
MRSFMCSGRSPLIRIWLPMMHTICTYYRIVP